MKVLVIPDIHLKPEIFDRGADLLQAGTVAERAVCLMDIADDWGQQKNLALYEQTYDTAIRFAQESPDTLWCLGNHDCSYLWQEFESGYSPTAANTVRAKLRELRFCLPVKRPSPIAYIHRIDNVLFMHGGLTEAFVEENMPEGLSEDVDPDAVIKSINSFGHREMWREGSPIWFRPQERKRERLYREGELLQVVGHTPVKKVCREGSVISTDVFSTYGNGMSIGRHEFLVIDTETWETRIVR